jgi:hypothetical protein
MTLSSAFFTAAEKTAQGESDCADDGNKKKWPLNRFVFPNLLIQQRRRKNIVSSRRLLSATN